jgi:hypothetical protein
MAAAMDPRAGQPQRPPGWSARVLAPLALLAMLVVVIVVISASVGDDDGGEDRRPRADRSQAGCEPTAEGEAARSDGYYVLQPADDLTSIADITCIEVEELQRLNPNLDPQLLPQGGCVDLRTDGCKALAEG